MMAYFGVSISTVVVNLYVQSMNNMMQVAILLPFAQARDGGTFAIIYPLMILKAFAVAALLDHHSSVRKKLSEEALVFFKALIL